MPNSRLEYAGLAVASDLAVLGQVTLPTGDDDELLGTGETGFLGFLIGSKDFGRFNVHGNRATSCTREVC